MDINGINNQALNAYRPQAEKAGEAARTAKKQEGGASAPATGDTLEVSSEAKLLAAARNEAMQADDVRAGRVAELKAQVEAGTYQIDNRKIAAKLLTEEAELFR